MVSRLHGQLSRGGSDRSAKGLVVSLGQDIAATLGSRDAQLHPEQVNNGGRGTESLERR